MVASRVVLSTDAEETPVQEADGAGQDSFAPQPFSREVAGRPSPQLRQVRREVEHSVELLAFAADAPALVVEVLLPTGIVDAGRLQVPKRVGTDPYFAPGWRDCQRSDPGQRLGILDERSRRVSVLEAAPARPPRDPGSRAIDAPKPRH
jgi:hypothetical protein